MYFITICTYKRECLFGEIKNEEIILNEIGHIVENEWLKTEEKRKNVKLDEYKVMPNHFHGIVFIDYKIVGIDCNQSLHKFGPQANNLFAIIRGFKGAVTNQIKIKFKTDRPIWQTRFYDRIIRNEKELEKIRLYISSNEGNWPNDIENPIASRKIK